MLNNHRFATAYAWNIVFVYWAKWRREHIQLLCQVLERLQFRTTDFYHIVEPVICSDGGPRQAKAQLTPGFQQVKEYYSIVALEQRPATLDFSERSLYQQIHPAKLATDISTSLISLYLFWLRDIASGLIVGIVPSIVASVVIIRFVSLDKYKESSFGTYIGRYMTRNMQALRAIGQMVGWIGAWFQLIWIVATGYVVILLAWLRGKLFPESHSRK